MRNRLAILALIAGIVGTLRCANADAATCLPDGANLSDATPFVPTAAQKKVMRDSYSSPEVAGLTATIAHYLAGSADSVSTASLRVAHSDALLRHPYALLSDDRNIMGGFDILVVFPKTYDAFRICDYRLGDTTTWQVRAFEKLACDPQQRAWIRNRYGTLMSDVHS